MLSALVVSNQIIYKAKQDGITDLTPMKLQKLLYYVFGEYLAVSPDNQPLFSERFEAWKYGPVLPSVYQQFRNFGAENITRFYEEANGRVYVPSPKYYKKFYEVFDLVWKKYKNKSGIELSELTHQQAPWREALTNWEIDNDTIKKYFTEHGICKCLKQN